MFILYALLITFLILCIAIVGISTIMIVDYLGYDIPEWVKKLTK